MLCSYCASRAHKMSLLPPQGYETWDLLLVSFSLEFGHFSTRSHLSRGVSKPLSELTFKSHSLLALFDYLHWLWQRSFQRCRGFPADG